MDYDELITVLIETEAMINSWPLTYLSEEDNTEAITPFHLVHGRNIAAAREMNLTQSDVNCKHWWFDKLSETYSTVTESLLGTILQQIHSCSLWTNDVWQNKM